ncbi:MAG: NadS family protein [bacterium]
MDDRDFEDLIKSIRQAGKIKRGELRPSRVFEFKPVNIKKIRNDLNLSQPVFARMIGVSPKTLRNWEQGRRQPTGPARALLKVVQDYPEIVARSLGMDERKNEIA